MFDKFQGLPLHILVLHFVVVLVPMVSMATIIVLLYKPLRDKLAPLVAVAQVGMLVLTFVTVQAGEALKDKLNPSGNPQAPPTHDHEDWGRALLWVVLALAVVSVVTAAASKAQLMPAAVTGLAVVTALVAVTSVFLTIETGHTGSQSHWGYLYGKR